jgi:hypothetical protein
MHDTMDGWVFVVGRVMGLGIVPGVGWNMGLADAELPDESESGLTTSWGLKELSLRPVITFGYKELSGFKPQSQKMASSDEFQERFVPCMVNDLGSEKYA